MAVPKYVNNLPPIETSPARLFFQHQGLIEMWLKKQLPEYKATELRQLITLYNTMEQRRKIYIGLCLWYKLTPSYGFTTKARRKLFNTNLELLEKKGLIEVIELYNGKQARLTEQGQYICKTIDDSLTEYYGCIFKQFNLVPKLPEMQ